MAFGDSRENSYKFFIYFRTSVHSFVELKGKISDNINYRDTWMRLSIVPQLTITPVSYTHLVPFPFRLKPIKQGRF